MFIVSTNRKMFPEKLHSASEILKHYNELITFPPPRIDGGIRCFCWRSIILIRILSAFFVWITCLSAFGQQVDITYDDHVDLSYYLNAQGMRKPIQTKSEWQKRRPYVLSAMQKVMGPLPTPEEPIALDIQIHAEVKTERFVRQLISYHTDSKTRRIRAYLLMPTNITTPRPAVLCLHQTTGIGKKEPAGLGGNPQLHYALHLAERGFITLAPDYPSFGDYPYTFPQEDGYISGTMKAIYENTRAIDLLQSLKEVDGERIGCIGHSLGGHNAIFTAAFDLRIKALVSNCGFTRFHKYYEGKLKGWTSPRYMPLINEQYGNDPDKVPFDFPEIIGTFAPRAFLASAPLHDGNFEVSGVKETMSQVEKIYQLYDAESSLQANYPDAAHSFPESAREVAYRFLEKHLGLISP